MGKLKYALVLASGAFTGFVLVLVYTVVPIAVITVVLTLILTKFIAPFLTSFNAGLGFYTPLLVKFLILSLLAGSIVTTLIDGLNRLAKNHAKRTFNGVDRRRENSS